MKLIYKKGSWPVAIGDTMRLKNGRRVSIRAFTPPTLTSFGKVLVREFGENTNRSVSARAIGAKWAKD